MSSGPEEMVCLHHTLYGHNKFFNYWIEWAVDSRGVPSYHVVYTYGNVPQKGKRGSLAVYRDVELARECLATRVAQKRRVGYEDVTAPNYQDGLTFSELAQKSVLVGREIVPHGLIYVFDRPMTGRPEHVAKPPATPQPFMVRPTRCARTLE